MLIKSQYMGESATKRNISTFAPTHNQNESTDNKNRNSHAWDIQKSGNTSGGATPHNHSSKNVQLLNKLVSQPEESPFERRAASTQGRRVLAANQQKPSGYKYHNAASGSETARAREEDTHAKNEPKAETLRLFKAKRSMSSNPNEVNSQALSSSGPKITTAQLEENKLNSQQHPGTLHSQSKKRKRYVPSITSAEDILKQYSLLSKDSKILPSLAKVPRLNLKLESPKTARGLSTLYEDKLYGIKTVRESRNSSRLRYIAGKDEASSELKESPGNQSATVLPQSIVSSVLLAKTSESRLLAQHKKKPSLNKMQTSPRIMNQEIIDLYSTDSTKKILLNPFRTHVASWKVQSARAHKNQ